MRPNKKKGMFSAAVTYLNSAALKSQSTFSPYAS